MREFFNVCNPFMWLAIGFFFVNGIVSIFYFVEPKIRREKNCLWKIHQIFFNGAGAFIGWVALYYFFQSDMCKIGIQHFIALLIGFLGVTGYLPYAVMSLLKRDIFDEIKEALKRKTK